MNLTLGFVHRLRRIGVGLVAVAAFGTAFAQTAEGPGRVARFEATDGSVQFQSAVDSQIRLADPAWPLTTGDRIWTAAGSRAELHLGGTILRLGDGSDAVFTALDDRNAQIRLTAGTVGLAVRDLQAGERVEIDTPNLAVLLDRPGRWRVDVDTVRNTTRVTAEQGSGTLYGSSGQALTFVAPQSRDFAFRSLAESPPLASTAGDSFDRWSGERERLLAQSPSLRYASADIPGVAQLDAYGDWSNDARYGAIWYPRTVAAGWTPYSNGRWEWIPPWGWTWVDQAPWGFAPSHYGQWTQAGNRWGWVPGPARGRQPYAAALPFHGARPLVPQGFGPGRATPPGYTPQRIGSAIEPLADAVRRDQWERTQRARQDQWQGDMQRQQQLREAQQRFQPSYGQRQLQDQRWQVEQQQQQLMFQQQRLQQDQMRQQQMQQQQLQQQQMQGRQQQIDQQQRQMQFEQQRQQQQMQRQVQQQQGQLQQQQQQQQMQQHQMQVPMQRQGGQQRGEPPRFGRPPG